MVHTIRPLTVVAHKNVSQYIHDDTDPDWNDLPDELKHQIAVASKASDEDGVILDRYVIDIMLPTLRLFYNASQYALDDLFQAFLNGVDIHEISHILFETPDHKPSDMDAIYEHIWNTLVDVHDEFWMSYFYPAYAPYIQFALSIVQHATPASKNSELDQDLLTLYFLSRFGILPDSYDTEFANICLPLIHSTITIFEQENVLEAVKAVYTYLEGKHKLSKNQKRRDEWDKAAKNKQGGKKEGVSKETLEQAAGKNPIMATGSGQLVAELQQQKQQAGTQKGKQKSKQGEKMAGLQSAPILFNEADAAFVRKVITEHPDQIARMRAAFMLLWDAPEMVESTDGDVNWQMQQQLYMASFTHEEIPGFLLPMDRRPSLSVIVSRDISDSTDDMCIPYAVATVLFVASLSDIEGVELCEMDFNYDAQIKLELGQNVEQLALAPVFEGGTSIDDVVVKIKAMTFREAVRLHFIITDGYIGNWPAMQAELQELEKNTGLVTFVVEVVPSGQVGRLGYAKDWPNSFYSSIDELPEKLIEHVVAAIQKKRGYTYGH